MYTLITIFYVSLIGIFVMIILKRREVLSGNQSMVSKAGAGSDHIFQAFFQTVGRGISYINKHTFIALGNLVAFHVLRGIRGIYVEIKHRFISHPRGKKLIDAVRGRGEIKTDGASFYLRRIAAKDK